MKKALLVLVSATMLCLLAACGTKQSDVTTTESTKQQESTTVEENKTLSADEAIKGITAIGVIDTDGTKAAAIAIEYAVAVSADDVSAEDYEAEIYKPDSSDYLVGYDNIGVITDVYVNDKPEMSDNGGVKSGSYVIVEVSTDYTRTGDLAYLTALAVGVKQVKDIKTSGSTITANTEMVTNYDVTFEEQPAFLGGGTKEVHTARYEDIKIVGLDEYQIYGTSTYDGYWKDLQDGDAWVVEDCFNEKSGETYDYELGYALWLPEDYSKDGKYALVTVDHTITGDPSPFEALLTNYGPTYFISDEAQNIVKEAHGLDGLIVVVPLIIERVDDNSCVPAMWMALVSLWDHLIETYNIDENYVYGAGQSMGGMLLMQTNTNRDNYFAGMLCYGNQWGQNYYKDATFARGMGAESYEETAENTPRHYPSTASTEYIWDYSYDTDGNKVYEGHDPYNFYYLISDDNLMVFNGSTNALSLGLWNEMSQLYKDTTGSTIIAHTNIDGLDQQSVDEANKFVTDYVEANKAANNIFEFSWVGNGNDGTAIWSRTLTANYEWLLKQSRQDEIKRAKLDINKPFELADEQLKDEDHLFSGFVDKETGEQLYYLTAKKGSGTQYYSSSCLPTGSGNPADCNPGWLPTALTGINWEDGVSGAQTESITAISGEGGYVAVAVKYDVDMSNAYAHLVGDKVYNSDFTQQYDDYFVTNAPFEFFDENGNSIDCEIVNYYVSDTAEYKADATRGEGQGKYIIFVLKTPVSAKAVTAIQRTTIITDKYIASALNKVIAEAK